VALLLDLGHWYDGENSGICGLDQSANGYSMVEYLLGQYMFNAINDLH